MPAARTRSAVTERLKNQNKRKKTSNLKDFSKKYHQIAAMEKLEQELKEEFQNVSQELDLISIKCIEIQRQLFEVTLNHRINDILGPKKEEEEGAKKSESETKKDIGEDEEMK